MNPYAALVARLAEEPALAEAGKPEAAVLVWAADARTLLWASPAAQALRAALTDEAGHVFDLLKSRIRLKALAEGLAPRQGMRLERLWLDPDPLAPPVTCACRQAFLGSEPVLVTLLIGRPAFLRRRPLFGRSEASDSSERTTSQRPRRTVRFVWQMDASTVFTEVSPELAEAVGPMASDILGRSWAEVARTAVEDRGGMVASFYRTRRTWSGYKIAWAIDNTDLQVPVDWAGMPIQGEDGALLGFRGFGLLQPQAVHRRKGSRIAADLVSEHAVRGDDADLSAGKAKPPTSEDAGPKNQPGLSSAERNAFREIARALSASLESGDAPLDDSDRSGTESPSSAVSSASDEQGILDEAPIGILIHRHGDILFANRFLLTLSAYGHVGELQASGGLDRLFQGSPSLRHFGSDGVRAALTGSEGNSLAVEIGSSPVSWQGMPADLMLIRPVTEAPLEQRLREAEEALKARGAQARELEAILDTATDGVVTIDETGRILSLNRSAEALFGYDQREVVGDTLTVLLAPESHLLALDYIQGLRAHGVAALLNDGREVLGRVSQGGTIALFMTMTSFGEGPNRKFCAVLRDITSFKKTESELIAAKHKAEDGSAQKSDFLAKISHEIRTPLNAIIGFAEMMLEERFGPIGNDRYKDYLKDIHESGAYVISLVNDLLDLAKIEAGRMELTFTEVDLNDLTAACFNLLQPQSARERIVMRTSFTTKLPPIAADARSVRQIVLNLVSNAIKFTEAGGQIILSTALTDRGEIIFRVRDTGIGMTEKEVVCALEPFRQIATTPRRGGTGLGLPLTKALVEANHGALRIVSAPKEGTLVEVIFPPAQVTVE